MTQLRAKRGPYYKTRQIQPPNPTGICECGCSGTTPIAKVTNIARGIVAGHHIRRIPSHRNIGIKRGPIGSAKSIAPPNPSGICMCGECGLTTSLARQSDSARGLVIGEYVPYIHNHHGKAAVRYIEQDRGFRTPCWIWQLSRDKNGYGITSEDGFPRRAHRVYCERAHGPIPDGYNVDHLCHVTSCVNPDHLEAVPPIINQRRKRRVKLTEELAVMIRASVATPKELGKQLGVGPSTILAVRNGKTWVNR